MANEQPTPWRVEENGIWSEIYDIDDEPVDIDCDIDNATRIVACVNACDGISSGQLTRGELKLGLRKLAEVSNECDELLEALKMADCLLRGANMNRDAVELKVRAAIAKAESRREEP